MARDPKTDPEILTAWKVTSDWTYDEGERRRAITLVSVQVVKTPTRYRFVSDAGRRDFGYRTFLEAKDLDVTPEQAIARFRHGLVLRRDRAYDEANDAERTLADLRLVEIDYLDTKGAHRGP